jgi:hypothetical protein
MTAPRPRACPKVHGSVPLALPLERDSFGNPAGPPRLQLVLIVVPPSTVTPGGGHGERADQATPGKANPAAEAVVIRNCRRLIGV